MTSEEIDKMHKENEQYSKSGFGRWSWFAMIERLAGKDITKFEDVVEQNFITCLNLLSFWKEEAAEMKRMEDINKQNK